MKTLVVVRHGEYDYLTENLDVYGQAQIEALGAKLAGHLNGGRIAILSSTAPRAIQTSEILSRHLGVGFDSIDALHSEGGDLSPSQANEVMGLVGELEGEYDVVVLSTHFEFIGEFPTVWGRTKGFSIPGDVPSKGDARVVDVETGRVSVLSSGI